MKRLLLSLFACGVPLMAQVQIGYFVDYSNGQVRLPERFVNQLPPASVSYGQVFIVTDATSAGSCSTGQGTAQSICRSNGTSWVSIGGAGGGGSSVGSNNAMQAGDGSGGFKDSGCSASSGALSCTSFAATNGSAAGYLDLGQGTAPSPGTSSVRQYAPASVTAYTLRWPGSAATGIYYGAATGNDVVMSQLSTNGSGNVLLSAGTAAIASGKTFTSSNTWTATATDSSTVAFGAGGTVAYRIASGSSALGTSAISPTACATTVTGVATGGVSTDTLIITPNADISGVTGYTAAVTGGLTLYYWVSADQINLKVCNPTNGTVTPGAVTVNWRLLR